MGVSALNLNQHIQAIGAGIKQIIKTHHDHKCLDKENCDFALAIFSRIAGEVFPSNTFDELGKAYEGISYCDNAGKAIRGE